MSESFVEEELGEVTLIKPRDQRSKNKIQDEYTVVFESKQVRDTIKSSASNLANVGEGAGMRLHLPDHLQRDFQTLMNLSFDLKKKNPLLKRNIKFDEEDKGLFMDIRLADDGDWKRIKPAQAAASNKNRRKNNGEMDSEELRSLLGVSYESE